MASYDSDSSGGEGDEYTETNVLLGYASNKVSDDTISHLGGRPEWLDPAIPPSAALAKCKTCQDLMVLLLQLNGDLPEFFPGHERRLYVLSCRRKTCRRKEGSVRALRGVRLSKVFKKDNTKTELKAETQAAKPTVNIGETLFGARLSSSSSYANPFSTTTSSSAQSNPFSASSASTPANPFAIPSQPNSESDAGSSLPPSISSDLTDLPKTFASALIINTSPKKQFDPAPALEPWPEESSLPPAYPLYYLIDADYEILDKVSNVIIPKTTMDLDEPSSSGNPKEDKDIYESTIDKTFQKFADRLAHNPDQVIRYEFKGQPLLYSKHDAVGKLLSTGVGSEADAKIKLENGTGSRIPRCVNCGAGRVFEVQMTPHAIMELESEEVGIDGMEWGTIIVGVCERDCQARGLEGDVGYVEEWAGVQWEELSEKR